MRDLDAEIQGELEEMMSGLSDKEIYGEPEKATQRGATAEPGPKKARLPSAPRCSSASRATIRPMVSCS